MGATSHSPESVRGQVVSQQAGTAVCFSVILLLISYLRAKPKSLQKPMAMLLPTYFRDGVSPLSAEPSSVI